MNAEQPITQLLRDWRRGDSVAGDAVLRQIYPTLQQIARMQLRRHDGAFTLQPTELVNELYLRLNEQRQVDYRSRDHFYAVAALLVRRLVLDHVRERGAIKRGGLSPLIRIGEIDENDIPVINDTVDWIGLDKALDALEKVDPESVRVVELKFFAGLTGEQIAVVCAVSTATVNRTWRFARAWLADYLQGSGADGTGTPPA